MIEKLVVFLGICKDWVVFRRSGYYGKIFKILRRRIMFFKDLERDV